MHEVIITTVQNMGLHDGYGEGPDEGSFQTMVYRMELDNDESLELFAHMIEMLGSGVNPGGAFKSWSALMTGNHVVATEQLVGKEV